MENSRPAARVPVFFLALFIRPYAAPKSDIRVCLAGTETQVMDNITKHRDGDHACILHTDTTPTITPAWSVPGSTRLPQQMAHLCVAILVFPEGRGNPVYRAAEQTRAIWQPIRPHIGR